MGGASTWTDAGSLIAEEQLGRSGARLEQDGHEVPVSYLEETENNSCLEIAIFKKIMSKAMMFPVVCSS